jgi:hypothetical protein
MRKKAAARISRHLRLRPVTCSIQVIVAAVADGPAERSALRS